MELNDVLKIGEVCEVSGRIIKAGIYSDKNSEYLNYNGSIVKSISIGSYVLIRKGFSNIIGKVEGEYMKEDFSEKLGTNATTINRLIGVTILGTLENDMFVHGATNLPMIGNYVYVVTDDIISNIFLRKTDDKLSLGTLVGYEGHPFEVNVQDLLCSHIGIFGNTGSGKSNTLAKLYKETVKKYNNENFKENSRFVIFDFNKEYSEVFKEENPNLYQLSTKNTGKTPQKYPLCAKDLTDVEFWTTIFETTDKTQKLFIDRCVKKFKDLHVKATADITVHGTSVKTEINGISLDAVTKNGKRYQGIKVRKVDDDDRSRINNDYTFVGINIEKIGDKLTVTCLTDEDDESVNNDFKFENIDYIKLFAVYNRKEEKDSDKKVVYISFYCCEKKDENNGENDGENDNNIAHIMFDGITVDSITVNDTSVENDNYGYKQINLKITDVITENSNVIFTRINAQNERSTVKLVNTTLENITCVNTTPKNTTLENTPLVNITVDQTPNTKVNDSAAITSIGLNIDSLIDIINNAKNHFGDCISYFRKIFRILGLNDDSLINKIENKNDSITCDDIYSAIDNIEESPYQEIPTKQPDEKKRIFNEVIVKILTDLNMFERFMFLSFFFFCQEIGNGTIEKSNIHALMESLDTKINILSRIFSVDKQTSQEGRNVDIISLMDLDIDMQKIIPLIICKKLYSEKKKSKDGPLNKSLHIIIDEAHNILSTSSAYENEEWKKYRLECFDKIIKEGRKFGTFLTISSQRPSDISDTIISQLHNYFIHCLMNEEDLRKISKAVSFSDKSTNEMIPILSPGNCIFAGLASNFPVLAKINILPEGNQPQSENVKISTIWHQNQKNTLQG